jgi:hypothetical protein
MSYGWSSGRRSAPHSACEADLIERYGLRVFARAHAATPPGGDVAAACARLAPPPSAPERRVKGDIVVTIPRERWREWLAEGDLAGEPWSGRGHAYRVYGGKPPCRPGDRCYIVSNGLLRGWAPILHVTKAAGRRGTWEVIRGGDAVACTVALYIPGFRGWRKPWWPRECEKDFPLWRDARADNPTLVKRHAYADH